ncbi:SDR family oxidoreductase [Caldimonas brevitalea]|uniref:Short-chain dehydrogenase n=1 Tax=Caldimonas brevitalea TaxID=413882 RepID=A0A0G3BNW8_9BURK|nr:SDR family oxidoreductase [Caldimonas brevitalea]AKJ31149.1 short-chain dehydrogenase [Caldimonas brevitalea]
MQESTEMKQRTPQRVLVVGGGSGMGRAVVAQLLARGDAVVAAGRSRPRLNTLREALATPARLDTETVDVTQEQDVERLFRGIGELDHIVCTAADIAGAYELLPQLSMAAVERVVRSKLLGPLMLAKHGAPCLPTTGSITFTSGIAAYRPAPKGAAVAAANAGLEGLAKALAVELGPVRVNVVSPGWVDTGIWQHVAGDAKRSVLDAMAERLPVRRTGQPSDIAQAILHLLDNGYISGTVVHVDGGHRLA